MQVSEAMTNDVRIASPNQTIRDAARLMAQIDAGVLPVGENDRLVGMITDRFARSAPTKARKRRSGRS